MSKRPSSKYIQIEAESSDEDIDSSVVSEDIGGYNVEPNYTTHRDVYRDKIRDLEERYAKGDLEEEDDVIETAEVPNQASLFPKPSDPLLFLVRCKTGKEKQIANRILEHAQEVPDVTSIVQKDGLKGYIYIEAFKKTAVEEAISKVKNVYKNKLTPIPLSEMTEALSCKKEYMVKEFASIKSGKYKGDVVQILENYEDCCQIKAVPRLKDRKKLFDPEEFRNKAIAKNGGYYYNRDFFKGGYLIKTVLKTSLDFDAEPSFDDLKWLKTASPVRLNDTVKVIRGDLKGFEGKVVSSTNTTCVITDGTSRFDVDAVDLELNVAVGDAYSYKGENGLVLKIDGGEVVLGIKEMTDEVRVKINDLEAPKFAKPQKQEIVKSMKKRTDPLVNRTVQIVTGIHKGLKATVKEVYRDKCRVQLSSNLEFVNLHRNELREIAPVLPTLETPGYRTPGQRASGAFTPGYKTPGYATPGFKTPGYKTPGYQTPGYQTPGYKTPGYATPGHVMPTYDQTHKGIQIVVDGVVKTVKSLDSDTFTCLDESKCTISEIEPVVPTKNYEQVFIFRGDYYGKFGTVNDFEDNIVKIQIGQAEVVRVKIEDCTIQEI